MAGARGLFYPRIEDDDEYRDRDAREHDSRSVPCGRGSGICDGSFMHGGGARAQESASAKNYNGASSGATSDRSRRAPALTGVTGQKATAKVF